jgi:formylglycine-generating enzyme required for sulfatase activity
MSEESPMAPIQIPGYEIGARIGVGGMGEVFLGRQVTLNRPVAIKLMTLDAEIDPDQQLDRFRREAELMAVASHPNIVSVHDFGIVDSRPYLVMEYVEGGDLRRCMTPNQPMALERVRAVVPPVARALAYLHRLGILHRDLKPENILLHHEDNPKVTDFGIAVLHAETDATIRPDVRVGTLGYVAPEQHYGLKVDETADQYSLAALTYELLTGHVPLGVIHPPSAHNDQLPPEVDAVLLRALEEERDERYPTIIAFSDALERALIAPRTRSRRRKRAAASLAALACLTSVTVLLGSQAAPRREAPSSSVAQREAPHRFDAAFRNSIDMELVHIPPGEFLMGAVDSDEQAEPTERPRHRVTITRAFDIGRYEVTVGQFRQFIEASGYETEAESNGRGGLLFDEKKQAVVQDPELTWRTPSPQIKPHDDQPVVQVSWNDAMAFCEWLSRKEDRTYRLPTEAEWEYACRAESTTVWCAGDSDEDIDAYAWTPRNADRTIHCVGRKQPNAFGLHDMHGNVWEWCLDGQRTYRARSEVDPIGPTSGDARICRGGSYDWEVAKTRSSTRYLSTRSHRYLANGFRVVCLVGERGGSTPNAPAL